jgi:hypothetical protein
MLPSFFLPNSAAPVALSASTPDVKNFCGAENTLPLGKIFGQANIVTQVGNGKMYLLMLGMGNIATKEGDGDVIVGMFGVGNVITHVGNGMTAALMVYVGVNFFTKVGNGTTLALMFSAGGNIFTHIGNGPLPSKLTWVTILA